MILMTALAYAGYAARFAVILTRGGGVGGIVHLSMVKGELRIWDLGLGFRLSLRARFRLAEKLRQDTFSVLVLEFKV